MPADALFFPLRDNPSMPAASVIPVLHYPDVLAGAAWLCEAFGFVERLRIGGHRIQLSIGDGAVVVAQGAGPDPAAGVLTHSIMVRVTNVDQHFRQAQKAGATIVTDPVSFPYGERQYSAVDPAGHVWTFSQSEFSIDPSAWGGRLHSANTTATSPDTRTRAPRPAMSSHQASCSCGQLTATTSGGPLRVSVCHCLACQRRTGSVFGAQARFHKESVAIRGQSSQYVRVGDAGGRATFHFCPACGATVYFIMQGHDQYVAIPVGAFAEPGFPPPTFSVYEERMHLWVRMPDGIEHMP